MIVSASVLAAVVASKAKRFYGLPFCGKSLRANKMPGPLRSGIFVLGLLFSLGLQADCPPLGPLQAVQLAAVTDGDSLRLQDGRRVRLLGINAPEMARKAKPAEPFATQAAAALRERLAGQQTVYLHRYGQDRYGRLLAEVYRHPDRGHLGEWLLRRGLARAVVVPPHQRADDCLWRSEARARQGALGVWAQAPLLATRATAADQGFVLLAGQVVSVSRGRTAIWIDLRGDVVVRIGKSDWGYFADENWQQWPGRWLELRGWLRHRSVQPPYASLKIDLRHPAMMRWLPPSDGSGAK